MRFSRRHIIAVCLLLAVLVGLEPVTALAAPPPPPLVAVILPRDNARFQAIHATFLKQFDDVVSVAGKPRLYVQTPNPDVMSLRNSIRKAVALGADLMVVYGTLAATAALQEDFTEPLIFAGVFEPAAMGLAPSNRKKDNLITGVHGHAPVQTLLKVLQETIGTSRLAVPVDLKSPAGKVQIEVLNKAACRRAPGATSSTAVSAGQGGELCWLEVVPTGMQTSAGLIKALQAVTGQYNAIYLGDLIPNDAFAADLLAYAARAGVPVVSQFSGTAEQGALITLEADSEEQGELLAQIARKIIHGELPEDIPLVIPRKVSLVVNLKVARDLGIQVPFSVLTQANRVVR